MRYYTRRYGLAHTILRYADVYGETDSDLAQHPISHFTRMLLERQHPLISGIADEVRDHVFIDDVVRANMCAIDRGTNQTLHISSGQGYTLNQLYAAVASLLESSLEPVYISHSHVEASPVVLDNSLAHHVLGWQPEVSFATGVRCAVERLCEQHRHAENAETEVLMGVGASV